MTANASLWDQFVAGAGADAATLASAAGDAGQLAGLGHVAFRIGLSSLLLGADDVGQLALAVEHAIDRSAGGEATGDQTAATPGTAIDPTTGAATAAAIRAALGEAIATLAEAFAQLGRADRSGARVEGLALDARRRALEAVVPRPSGAPTRPSAASGTAPRRATTAPRTTTIHTTMASANTTTTASPQTSAAPPHATTTTAPHAASPIATLPSATAPIAAIAAAFAGAPAVADPAGFTWTPPVDDAMIELFFDEATERLAALAGKLVEIERRPDDRELLRDVFRDLHTVKGSSAMVGLAPVNRLAHAAEDLVGQIRDAGRAVDGHVVDALLAALDALRDMLGQARSGDPISVDPAPAVARLRNPSAGALRTPASDPTDGPTHGPTHDQVHGQIATATGLRAAAADAARQTIRVDFDKLDHLLNLVGELVLGRDRLRGAVHSLGSITTELGAERVVARRVAQAYAVGGRGGAGEPGPRGLARLGDELSRAERVLAEVTGDLDQGTDRLDAISAELRDQVMRLRMISVAGIFRKHVRTVRDLAASLGKRARLELDGEDTELDKLLVEALDEPLLHLVRNAVDHGAEPPDARIAAGKPAEVTIRIAAAHRGNQVEIRVSDDGRGLDPARLRAKAVERGLITTAEAAAMDDAAARELIFRAGFSTAAQVSEVSGRGVGMDVVRQTIIGRLKGTIDVESTPGQGSAFVLKLPLTLAIIQVIVARAGGETFAIPLDVVKRVLAIDPRAIELIGDREVCVVRGHHVPLIRLDHVLELDRDSDAAGQHQLVLVEHGPGHDSYALVCDHLLGKREIVIKSLGPLLAHVPCTAGATLLGDRVALILDVPAIIRRALDRRPAPGRGGPGGPARTTTRSQPRDARHVLLVEDSDTVRESLRRLLVDAGYLVTVAVDGQHGLELARSRPFDLVSTDVMMPRLDGYELTRALRAMPDYADTPIVMVTSMGERIDRVRGFDAGVDEYITKPHDRSQLLRAVRKLLGQASDAPSGGDGGDRGDGEPPPGGEGDTGGRGGQGP